MRYIKEENFVLVIGKIWMPHDGMVSYRYNLTPSDVGQIGEFTRKNVQIWLNTHSGDFSQIVDFKATIGDDWIEWEKEESEDIYQDAIGACCEEG